MRTFIFYTLLIFQTSSLLGNESTHPKIPKEIENRLYELQKDIFHSDDFSSLEDMLKSSSNKELTVFIDALESSDDPEVLRTFLKMVNTYELTTNRFVEIIRKRLQSNPQLLRRVVGNVEKIKGEMKLAKLRFPTPVRCGIGIGVYVAMQDWFLSYNSSFIDNPYRSQNFKENVVDPGRLGLMGLATFMCLYDLINTKNNFSIYLKELRLDQRVEKNREHFEKALKEIAFGRRTYSYSKKRFELYSMYDQYSDYMVDEIADRARKERVMNSPNIKNILRKHLDKFLSFLRKDTTEEKINEVLDSRNSQDEKLQALYSHFHKQFSLFFASHKNYPKWEAVNQLQKEFDLNTNSMKISHQPKGAAKYCYASLGAIGALWGIKAAAGRNETLMDDSITKNVRKYYNDDNEVLVTTMLLAPCFWSLRLFPAAIYQKINQKPSMFLLDDEELKEIKKAIINAEKIPSGQSRFTSLTQILDAYYRSNGSSDFNRTLPSNNCLKKLLKLAPKVLLVENKIKPSRNVASFSAKDTCKKLLKDIFFPIWTYKEPSSYLNVSYDEVGQFINFNKLGDKIKDQDNSIDDTYYRIKVLASEHCN